MVRIQGIEGMQYPRDGSKSEQLDYALFNRQYATSTYREDHDMYPDLIIQPKGDEDVVKAVNWARSNKIAISVKSGGHQYSGASSTSGRNIQLDLSNTYKHLMRIDPVDPVDQDKTLIYVGVSIHLKDFSAYLIHNSLFIPHGQCAYVCIGGHVQTGGYGQVGRSFGLLGDHVRTIRMVCHDGIIRDITKRNDTELFNAILGGSPGNFGIITHYIIEVYKAAHYVGTVEGPRGIKGPYGLKGIWMYSPKILKKLLTAVAEMADDPEFPRGFDLNINVLSTDFPNAYLFPEGKDAGAVQRVQNNIKYFLANQFLKRLNYSFPAAVVLYAQWCPTEKGDEYDENVDKWFQRFRDLSGFFANGALQINVFDMDMSQMMGQWMFHKEREFELPYVKRTYLTNSRTLVRDNWADNLVKRIDKIYNPAQHLKNDSGDNDYERYLSCKLSVQIQCFGGNRSRFYTNRGSGTSYSWRDTTVMQLMDCFHQPDADSKAYAERWQAENDSIMVGPQSCFSKQDRRGHGGSYGDWNMANEKVWRCYYEDKEKYERLGRIRAKADPNGTFTPNPFAVPVIFTPN
ncbi:FAD binding domain-containing protein [Pseudomassariella vexata]|uniref:FAD binding domain-containing protein n=1 Tax=Pseudomassariella vexata TaxID=1141098 RepID=A0A1Y2DQ20_9PEZI|nr:FAD binding domain-containing protein [Pseudomassariella vexata]ORY60755.1 FAD binding domain-containing protein [Pseudomassariella vexata]